MSIHKLTCPHCGAEIGSASEFVSEVTEEGWVAFEEQCDYCDGQYVVDLGIFVEVHDRLADTGR